MRQQSLVSLAQVNLRLKSHVNIVLETVLTNATLHQTLIRTTPRLIFIPILMSDLTMKTFLGRQIIHFVVVPLGPLLPRCRYSPPTLG